MENTYWNKKGKYQALADKLDKLIPIEGSVNESDKNKALEKYRIACNCYHDLYNNGLGNRAKEFRKVFGFGGTFIAKNNLYPYKPLEDKIDDIILQAAKEQGIN